jgi:hypothetical protein
VAGEGPAVIRVVGTFRLVTAMAGETVAVVAATSLAMYSFYIKPKGLKIFTPIQCQIQKIANKSFKPTALRATA